MTSSQISKQNRENASHSTGPTSEIGKLASRGNALKHGLTATVCALPNESFVDIQACSDAWFEACQPASHDEFELVEQLALGARRLRRNASAEKELLSEEIRNAEGKWDIAQATKLHNLTDFFRDDSVLALIELEHFGAGVNWLIERWESLGTALDSYSCLNSLPLIKEFLALSGYNPDRIFDEGIAAYKLALAAVCCIPNHKNDKDLSEYLETQMSFRWMGIYDEIYFEADQAIEAIRKKINAEIAALRLRAEGLNASDRASRAGAKDRAMAPADTKETRLFLRYMRSTELGFDRSLKTLMKLQALRQKGSKTESNPGYQKPSESVLQNEAERGPKPVQVPTRKEFLIDVDGMKVERDTYAPGGIMSVPINYKELEMKMALMTPLKVAV